MKIAIVGAGKLGFKIASALADGDYAITVIDKKEAALDRISQQLDVMTINEDGRCMSVLKNIGIKDFDHLLATTDNDEVNIVIAALAKKMGCHHVTARVRDPEHMNQFDFIREALNIDVITNPDLAITVEIYKYLAEKYTLSNGIFTTDKVSIIEFPASHCSDVLGYSISDIREEMPDFIVLALSRNGKIMIPHGTTRVKKDDLVYMLGEKGNVQKLSKRVLSKQKYRNLNKVMIIGGGKTGFYLARKLSEFGAAVKLVESNLDRCRYLAANLNKVMVLHADGTDLDFLIEENLEDMDAFVTATGYDEENLLLALTAKKHGIPDVISKVSHENYKDLIENMGLEMVMNPLDITTSNLLRFIQGSKKIISSVLIQGQAELLEIIVNPKMSMAHKPISQLNLPDGILIASIRRGSKLIIPEGNTKIEVNDRIIVLNLLSNVGEIEKLTKSKRL